MINGWHDGMGPASWILMTLFWVLVVVVIVWAVTRLPRGDAERRDVPEETDPHAILDARLARGEIDVHAYDEIRAKLDEPSPDRQVVTAPGG